MPNPNVVAINQDFGLMNAVCHIFPQANRILYKWHINKNVVAYVSSLINESEKEG